MSDHDRQVAAEIAAIFAHPQGAAGRLRDLEVAAGHRLVHPGEYLPFIFPAADWDAAEQVVSVDGREIRIVLINARKIGTGAFRRLIANITAAGLTPVVVAPMLGMPDILTKWGWKMTKKGDGFQHADEWRPA